MWRIDNRLKVSTSKNHKIPDIIFYFKTRVNAVSTYRLHPFNETHLDAVRGLI